MVEVEDVRAVATTSAPQGVVAECDPVPTRSFLDLAKSSTQPALIILDHLEDPQNVGAVARSAHAAGATGMVVSSRRAAPLEATAFKAAAGSLELLPVAIVNSVADAVRRLEENGVWTVGLDNEADESLFGCALFDLPVAIVVGAEGAGLSRLVAERVSKRVQIPMSSGVESLNASVAVGLAMYEVARVRGQFG